MITLNIHLIIAVVDIHAQYTFPPFLPDFRGLIHLTIALTPELHGRTTANFEYLRIITTFAWNFGQGHAGALE